MMTQPDIESVEAVIAILSEMEREARQRVALWLMEQENRERRLGHAPGNC